MNRHILSSIFFAHAMLAGSPIFSAPPPAMPDPNPPSPSEYAEGFIPIDLRVGGNQHYSAANRKYFTNIVANAVGDLNGDGFDDIVLLANAIPQNGAYGGTPTTYQYTHYCAVDGSSFIPGDTNYWQGEYLQSGDYLYNKATTLGTGFNPANVADTWFIRDSAGVPTEVAGLTGVNRVASWRFAPPSTNIVGGMVDGYTGSDLGWLQGDGRGHFIFRFITPSGAPVRIRMGVTIRLADLDNDGDQDIVLISAAHASPNNFAATSVADFPNTTTIAPFSGASRVFWLENTGWSGTQLTFTDHNIAEYNYDRLPVIFYGANQNVSGGWVGPYTTLSPLDVLITRVNSGNTRPDIVVSNAALIDGTYAASNYIYNGTNPTMDFLDRNYSSALPRPQIGDRWVHNQQFWPTAVSAVNIKTLFWYGNNTGAGPRFSTATYVAGQKDTSGTPMDLPLGKLIPLTPKGGGRVVVSARGASNGITVFRRKTSTDLRLIETSNQMPTGGVGTPLVAAAADIDGGAGDELVVLHEQGGILKISVFEIESNGPDNVDISNLFNHNFYYDTYTTKARPSTIALADINRDGLTDIIVGNKGRDANHKYSDPATILVNRTTEGAVSFRALRQTRPELKNNSNPAAGDNGYENLYAQVGMGAASFVSPPIAISTGNFNGDGFTDFVRTGPNVPAVLFLNNMAGLQRARITAVGKHPSGTQKTWTSIQGGNIDGAGAVSILINSQGSLGEITSDNR